VSQSTLIAIALLGAFIVYTVMIGSFNTYLTLLFGTVTSTSTASGTASNITGTAAQATNLAASTTNLITQAANLTGAGNQDFSGGTA
jgi:hypothetical protein